jgi:hypothetical protein
MSTPPAFLGSVPLSQPYSDSTFDGTYMEYDGTESVASLPDAAIDWVLVSLRTATGSDTEVVGSRKPAFVVGDGSVVGLDGQDLAFDGVSAGAYYTVVMHRNHLPVMSAAAVDFTSGPASIDFTTAIGQAHTSGGPPMKQVETGIWAMIGSDADADGQVTSSDFNEWLIKSKSVASGYLSADFDMDAQVTASDFNMFLVNTKAVYSSQVPN